MRIFSRIAGMARGVAGFTYTRKEHTMTLASATVLAVFATVLAAAMHTPRDASGAPVNRSRRTLFGDLRCLVGGTY
jgi:hypothetical protein